MKSFWRNVVLIALAHVVLIAGLIRWSVAAKASINLESIVWLGGAGDLSADESEKQESASPKQPAAATESSQREENKNVDEKPVVNTAKSEIELPTATPKPTATATPTKASPTPAPKARTTPKPTPKLARNATHSVAGGPPLKKALPTKLKPSRAETSVKPEKKDKIPLAKKDSAPQSGSGP